MATWIWILLLLLIPCTVIFGLMIRGGRARPPAESMVTDPVCGMRLAPSKAFAPRDTVSGVVYLCSQACVLKFDANPEAYGGHTQSRPLHAHMGI